MSTDNAAETQRKEPSQARSKELVSAIYEATVRILPKVGSYNITTKKIAEMAGVSIGSLYQYFPNKEALLGSLIDFSLRSSLDDTYKVIDEMKNKSIDESVDLIVDYALNMFLKEREKNSEIFRRAPELGRIPLILKIRAQIVERLADAMESHHPGRARHEYIRVSFIAANAVMGVIHTMLYDPDQKYTIDELSLELKTLLKSYFTARQQTSGRV
jgi:AcrR family transcriptional regulator